MSRSSDKESRQFDWMMDQFTTEGGGVGVGTGDNLLHIILEEEEYDGNDDAGGETDADYGTETAGHTTSGDEMTTPTVRPRSRDQEETRDALPQAGDCQPSLSPRRGRRKRLIDPFGELPPIKDLLEVDGDEMDEFGEPKKRRKRRRPRRFKCTQFDEPDKQLAWTLFRTADRDNDGRLSKKEFGMVVNSPRLDLHLSKEDVKRLMEDICHGRDNIKNCPMSFDEFFPFAMHLLRFFYGKKDAHSENHWVVLDKGFKSGVFYFNKETGETKTSRPLDYDAWHFKEPDLFEKALADVFEIADMNDDGKININDFIRIIISADFGLQLTDEDAYNINSYFVNEAGRKISMPYPFFIPMAKRLILTLFRARDPNPHEWCHLYTSNVGSFWFNKTSGESSRTPPKKYITRQQERLVDRELEMELLTTTADKLASTEKELEKEQKWRQDLQDELSLLSRESSDHANALEKRNKFLEKTTEEHLKKGKQIESLERERDKLNTKIQELEARALAGDKAEQKLESLRDELKSAQSMVRERDFDIRQLKGNLEKTNKALSDSKEKGEILDAKVVSLHHQLRVEIRRNQQMEKELGVIPLLRKELSETDERVAAVQAVVDEKATQLTHARYTLRDNKITIKNLEEENKRLATVEMELEHAQCEVATLKKLMEGKDRLLVKQCQQLANATGRQKSSDSLNYALRSCSDPGCPLYQNPKKSQSNQTNGHFKKKTPGKVPMEEMCDGNDEDMPTVPDLNERSSTYPPRDKRSRVARLRKHDRSALPRGSKLYEQDFMVAQFVHIGDRVRVKKIGTKILLLKPSDFLTGIVKFIGKIDKDPVDHHVYVGLRLDEPVGDTDGIINGKRYFHANRKHGKVVRITDIFLVLNAKTATYQRIIELVRELRHKTGLTRTYRDGDPELIEIP